MSTTFEFRPDDIDLSGPAGLVSRPHRDLLCAPAADPPDHVAWWDVRDGSLVHPPVPVGVGRITTLEGVRFGEREVVVCGGTEGVLLLEPDTARALTPVISVGEPISAATAIAWEQRDVIIAGGQQGGLYVVDPRLPSEEVELQDDAPIREASDDQLNRRPLAQALATRLQRRRQEQPGASFLVHLDGRWGSGKTTVLNLLGEELGDDWTIVWFNTWRQARVGPPWWTLLASLRAALSKRRSRPQRVWLWLRELFHLRVLQASGLPASLLLVAGALLFYILVRPRNVSAAAALTTLQGVVAALGAVGALFGGAQIVTRFLGFGWHSARGAKAFEDLDSNPMERVADHFTWLISKESRPVAFFIEDLDRCAASDVVELLEAIQTVVRNPDRSSGPCFVVAADGAWMRNAFEESYKDFVPHIAERGRPLGYLFLDKIFQLTLQVPKVSSVRQDRYLRHLLRLRDPAAPMAGKDAVAQARQQLVAASDDAAQQTVLTSLEPGVRDVLAEEAVRRQTEQTFIAATEHRLASFTGLLPDSPRAVKRFLNDFAMTRSVRTLEGETIPTATLALWTILQIRWPLLADSLARHPSWVEEALKPNFTKPNDMADDVYTLLQDEQVRATLIHEDGGPLTADDVRACRGG